MSILSFDFIVLFTLTLAAYYLTPLRARRVVLLLASAAFAVLSGWRGAAHLLAVGLLTWAGASGLARLAARQQRAEKERRPVWRRRRAALLALVLLAELGAMAALKYYPALAGYVNGRARRVLLPVSRWALPLGLSYFTFQSAGYLIDVYRGKAEASRDPLRALLFTGYFLQLPQGPISSWRELENQLDTGHRLEPVRFVSGFQLALWGAFKKLVIADRLAAVTQALTQARGALPGWFALGGAALYAVRLYADFSGGMDVARGLSRMLGIELPENFRRPFFAVSLADYWRRWHITLGAWFRAYVLYPLTSSRLSARLARAASRPFGKKTGRALPGALWTLLIFLLIGLWHGASWNALLYGAYFGVLMGASVLLEPVWKRLNKRFRLGEKDGARALRRLRTGLLTLPAQYFAFCDSPRQSFSLLRQSFSAWQFRDFAARVTAVMPPLEWAVAGAALALMFLVDALCERRTDLCDRLARAPVWLRWPLLLALILIVAVFGCYGAGFDSTAFLYTNF